MSLPHRRVLVVDADEDIRSVIEDLLTDYGYAVSQAADPDEATALLRQDEFDVVLCHLPLLHESDARLAHSLERLRPALRVVAMSASGRWLKDADADARVTKPFTRAELLAALDGSQSRPPAANPGLRR